MKFRQIVQDYFTFSRNERKGITILLVIFFLLAVANKIIFYFETPAKLDAELLNAELNPELNSIHSETKPTILFKFDPNTIGKMALDSLSLPEGIKRNIVKFREKGGKYYSAKDFKRMYGVTDSIFSMVEPFLVFENKIERPLPVKATSELFAFDPNTASDSVFLSLGISKKQIQIIRNYQSKGGVFRKSADFLKIYSISESQKKALAGYIVIEGKAISYNDKAEAKIILIEINGADSIELKSLPGIGNVLSKRIIKYRDLLGGFYTFGQLKEVYGLNEQTIQMIEGMIEIDKSKIQKVDLNFADLNELAEHPYLRNNLAKQIIKFRTRVGNITDPTILRDSLILSYDEYERLKPYL